MYFLCSNQVKAIVLVTTALILLVGPVTILTAMFCLELVVGLPRAPLKMPRKHKSARAVIIVPAHNEQLVIQAALDALRGECGECDILVVADNCSDETAKVARLAGVKVLERNDVQRQGKGYALEAAARALEDRRPEVVVILDADCFIDRHSLRYLIYAVVETNRPAQAVNLLRPDQSRSPMVQLSTFGFALKNLVRQRALQRLTGGVHLTGTGMAMPFGLFQSARLGSAEIVEDLVLGLELTSRGHPVQLVPGAVVWSSSSDDAGTLTQRRRWEGGYLKTAIQYGPSIFRKGIVNRDARSIVKALDLIIPPLALLMLLNLATLAIAIALVVLGASTWPLVTHACILAFAILLIFLVWLREGRAFISLSVLARLPLYVFWKFPLYLRLLREGAPRDWLRTGR